MYQLIDGRSSFNQERHAETRSQECLDIYLVEARNQSLLAGNACQNKSSSASPLLIAFKQSTSSNVNTYIPSKIGVPNTYSLISGF